MKITFLILAHNNPVTIVRLVSTLTLAGHTVVLHYDKRSAISDFVYLQDKLGSNLSVRFARRLKVRWGEWSICKATLNCIGEIEKSGWNPDYVYYASGADYPIRSSDELVHFLTISAGSEFIEGVPTERKRWVKGGPEQERYYYRFYTNWRDDHWLTSKFLQFQKDFGLKRKFVLGLEPHMGSQWWVLSWKTLQKVMELALRKDVQTFFSRTLIPDELFFQTLVCNLVPASRIVATPLTLYQFTDYMVPVIFCADHVEYLKYQPYFMARKISPHKKELFDELDRIWLGPSQLEVHGVERFSVARSEYEINRHRYRDGAPGLPLYGKRPPKPYEDLSRLDQSIFFVIGSSITELEVAHKILTCSKTLVCHGQLFHPDCIEFAHLDKEFAGYNATSLKLRAWSAPHFLANLVRASPGKTTGFLLRLGQGGDICEIILGRSNVHAILLAGDPFISFVESLSSQTPKLNERIDWSILETMSPSVLVRRWEKFLVDLRTTMDKLELLLDSRIRQGRSDMWKLLTEIDLDITKPSKIQSHENFRQRSDLSGWGGMYLSRWRMWMVPAGKNLDVPLTSLMSCTVWRELSNIISGLEPGRRRLIDTLTIGGVLIDRNYDPPDIGEPQKLFMQSGFRTPASADSRVFVEPL